MSVIGCKQGLLGSTKTPLLFKEGVPNHRAGGVVLGGVVNKCRK
jgi:hypothetical protein